MPPYYLFFLVFEVGSVYCLCLLQSLSGFGLRLVSVHVMGLGSKIRVIANAPHQAVVHCVEFMCKPDVGIEDVTVQDRI